MTVDYAFTPPQVSHLQNSISTICPTKSISKLDISLSTCSTQPIDDSHHLRSFRSCSSSTSSSSSSSIQTRSSSEEEEDKGNIIEKASSVTENEESENPIDEGEEQSECASEDGGERSEEESDQDDDEVEYTYVYDYEDGSEEYEEDDDGSEGHDDGSEEYEYEDEDEEGEYEDENDEDEDENDVEESDDEAEAYEDESEEEEPMEVDLEDEKKEDAPFRGGRPTLAAFRTNSFIERRKGKLDKFYTIDEYIAKGSFGVVCSATHIGTGTVRAIKELKKSKKNRERNEQCIKEFNILKDLDHPNILRMYELFEERKHYYIVTELCKGGDLNREIRSSGPYSEKDAAKLMIEVLACMNYCHRNKLVHRDLKPGNILLEENKKVDQIKIIDFGEATFFEEDTRLTEIAGTIAYMAPEVLKMSYGPKCDIWSCGVITYFVLSGKQPFKGANDEETCDNILRGEFSFDGPVWDDISSRAKDFIRKLLTSDEKSRPSAEEAMQHPWISKVKYRPSMMIINDSERSALNNLQDFEADSRLKVATLTFIASQLLRKEEKATIDEAFRLMDVDRDGNISREEFQAGYSKIFGMDISADEIDDIFDRIDLQGTGTIDYSEFVIAAIERKKLLSTENLKRSFDRFDLNGKGYLTRLDLQDCLDTDESLTNIIEQVDMDGDGKISFDEFVCDLWDGVNDAACLDTNLKQQQEDVKRALDAEIRHLEIGEQNVKIESANDQNFEETEGFEDDSMHCAEVEEQIHNIQEPQEQMEKDRFQEETNKQSNVTGMPQEERIIGVEKEGRLEEQSQNTEVVKKERLNVEIKIIEKDTFKTTERLDGRKTRQDDTFQCENTEKDCPIKGRHETTKDRVEAAKLELGVGQRQHEELDTNDLQNRKKKKAKSNERGEVETRRFESGQGPRATNKEESSQYEHRQKVEMLGEQNEKSMFGFEILSNDKDDNKKANPQDRKRKKEEKAGIEEKDKAERWSSEEEKSKLRIEKTKLEDEVKRVQLMLAEKVRLEEEIKEVKALLRAKRRYSKYVYRTGKVITPSLRQECNCVA